MIINRLNDGEFFENIENATSNPKVNTNKNEMVFPLSVKMSPMRVINEANAAPYKASNPIIGTMLSTTDILGNKCDPDPKIQWTLSIGQVGIR